MRLRFAVLGLVACAHAASDSPPATTPEPEPQRFDFFSAMVAAAVPCPASFTAAQGVCTTSGTERHCSYPEGRCDCVGPPLWQYGGCTGTHYSATFEWECVPKTRDNGCPGERPTVGAPCQGQLACVYNDRSSCDSRADWFACDQGRWFAP